MVAVSIPEGGCRQSGCRSMSSSWSQSDFNHSTYLYWQYLECAWHSTDYINQSIVGGTVIIGHIFSVRTGL